MKVGYRKLGLVLGAVAACALLPARADAQFIRYSPVFWSFEGSAGIALPLGDLSDVAESGPAFGIAASYFLNPRLALRAEGGLDLLGEKGTIDPDLRLWHFTGGFEYHITDPTGNATVMLDLGAGGVSFDTKVFTIPSGGGGSTTQAFNKTYFAANGGLRLGYNFARHGQTGTPMATIFIQGDLHLMFADEEDTELFASLAGQPGFGTVYEIPITAGLRFNIP